MPGRTRAPVIEQRHVLPRVIGARRRRIVAVIGGDDEQVVVAQLRQDAREPRVEALEVRGIAGDVVAVAVLRVEVDEVGEDQAAIDASAICASTLSMPSLVADGVDALRDAAAGEQILESCRSRRPARTRPSGDRARLG